MICLLFIISHLTTHSNIFNACNFVFNAQNFNTVKMSN